MAATFTSGVAAAIDAVGLVFLDIILKGTVLLVLACAASALLRRASAAVRHRVWCLVFLGLALLPALLVALPAWRLPILPKLANSVAALRGNPAAGSPSRAAQSEDVTRGGGKEKTAADVWGQGRLASQEDGGIFVAPANPDSRAARGAASGVAFTTPVATTPGISWPASILAVWLIGLVWFVVPIAVSPVYKRILVRNARPVADSEISRLLAELCRGLNVRRSVRLLEIDRSLVPMTWGLVWPTVLLPMAWRQWPGERRRMVLLHELAHVKRHDLAFQLAARLTCTLYWFHPLAWYALWRLRIERESACDDCVLMAGERASEYARQLVEIARSFRLAASPIALAMAHSTRLERRVQALLDHGRPRLPMSRATGRLAVLFAAVVLAGVSMIGPAGKSQSREPDAARSWQVMSGHGGRGMTKPSTNFTAIYRGGWGDGEMRWTRLSKRRG